MTELPDNFADFPVSVSERRKSPSGSYVSVRDMLITQLRMIDKGEVNPDRALLIMDSVDPDGNGGRIHGMRIAGDFPNDNIISLLTYVKYDIMRHATHKE